MKPGPALSDPRTDPGARQARPGHAKQLMLLRVKQLTRAYGLFPVQLAEAMLAVGLPESTPASRSRAAAQVSQSLADLPDSSKPAVHLAGALAWALAYCSGAVGSEDSDQHQLLERVGHSRVPGVAEYVKLIRSLAVVAWFEDCDR